MSLPIINLGLNPDAFEEPGERIEVRCCCDCRLLGTLPNLGESVPFVTKRGNLECLELTAFYRGVMELDGRRVDRPQVWTKAYKSKEFDIEDLRKIPGWKDHKWT